MPTVLITGANRGLGLEHVKQYAEQGWQVYACCRNPESADTLNAMASANSHVTILKMDVRNFVEIEQCASELEGVAIDVLINNAGIYGDSLAEGMAKQAFGQMDYDLWRHILETNLLAPFKVCEAFVDHVSRSEQKKIVMVSSDLGSITNNSQGQSYAYRSSKTGLCMLTKGLSVDLSDEEITVLAVAPGWCKTDLGGGDIAEVEPADSVCGQQKVIAEASYSDTGCWYNYKGETVAW